ncbi:PPE family protein [Nocardia altamirensis]|uniref:PPE family protein n=1 Tax=Nocardia altamirensis TaxID=472158 RepID=UPI000A045080|nr:PPE domain-containing protein [Nocardia altamirensis]
MEWVALPPEINSARLIAGAGVMPMQVAATAYTTLSAEFAAAASALTGLMAGMSAQWVGPTSAVAMGCFGTYLSWVNGTCTQLGGAAARAQAQVAAYELAMVTMPPLPVIEANQATGITLAATNFMGVNTAPLAANEAAYVAMWIQAAAVMSAYAAATAANAIFDPFMPSPPIVGEGPPNPLIATTLANAASTPLKDAQLAATAARATLQSAINEIALPVSIAMVTSARTDGHARDEQSAGDQQAQALARHGELQALLSQAQQVGGQVGSAAQQATGMATNTVQSAVSPATQLTDYLRQRLEGQPGVGALDNPGFAGVSPSSPTGVAMSSGTALPAASLQFAPSLAGMSGATTGFRLPHGWQGGMPPAMAPAMGSTIQAGAAEAAAAARAGAPPMYPPASTAAAGEGQPARRRAVVMGARIVSVPVAEQSPDTETAPGRVRQPVDANSDSG